MPLPPLELADTPMSDPWSDRPGPDPWDAPARSSAAKSRAAHGPCEDAEGQDRAAQPQESEPTSSPARRHPARTAVLVVLLAILAALVYCEAGYEPTPAARASLELGASGETAEGWHTFGDSSSACGIVMYPGARVDSEAYAPLMARLAEAGAFCVLVDAPFDMAFFNIGAADGIPDQYPAVERWYLAGHSLGGVAASLCLAAGDRAWDGLVLLASYSPVDVAGRTSNALTVVGDRDGVVDFERMYRSAENLPRGAQTVALEGANHAQFGNYGPQDGDGAATISADEQQAATVEAIARFAGLAGDSPAAGKAQGDRHAESPAGIAAILGRMSDEKRAAS